MCEWVLIYECVFFSELYCDFVSVQMELYSRLIQLRNSLASHLGLHTYMIFSNKSLLDVSQYRFSNTSHPTFSLMHSIACCITCHSLTVDLNAVNLRFLQDTVC